MKGIELPINVLIIVAIAIIVLIAVIAMFYPAWLGGSSSISLESVKSKACTILAEARECQLWPSGVPVVGFDANNDGSKVSGAGDGGGSCNTGATSADNLWTLCTCQYHLPNSMDGCTQCMKMCGCTTVCS